MVFCRLKVESSTFYSLCQRARPGKSCGLSIDGLLIVCPVLSQKIPEVVDTFNQ